MGVSDSCDRLPYFSSPTLSYHGSALGVWDQDNARIVNAQFAKVAAYSDQALAAKVTTSGIMTIINMILK
jgi:hypothetical protein